MTHLEAASRLALETQAVLLLLTNTYEQAREAQFRLTSRFPDRQLIVVPVPARVSRLDRLTRSSNSTVARLRPYGRVAAKRNLALVIARSLGWDTLLFLDDDIAGLDQESVTRAVGQLSARSRAVGWTVSRYPDNSVVCHSRRILGDRQEVFLGAGALLVSTRPGPQPPFLVLPPFPHTYNEDWLFLFDLLAEQSVIRMPDRDVTQDDYDPFEDPSRARREEAGDVLAEGLFSLLHRVDEVESSDSGSAVLPLLGPARTAGFWAAVIDGREQLIDGLIARAAASQTPDAAAIAASLRAARLGLAALSAHQLADFVTDWRHDVDAWRNWLATVPRFGDVDLALDWIGVPRSLTAVS